MGIMDFIRGELIEIIEFNDDSRDTLAWRFPDADRGRPGPVAVQIAAPRISLGPCRSGLP